MKKIKFEDIFRENTYPYLFDCCEKIIVHVTEQNLLIEYLDLAEFEDTLTPHIMEVINEALSLIADGAIDSIYDYYWDFKIGLTLNRSILTDFEVGELLMAKKLLSFIRTGDVESFTYYARKFGQSS